MCRTNDGLPRHRGGGGRRAFTLLELLLGMTISAILVASMSVLAMTVNQSAEFNSGQNAALQHARVVLDRIQRTVGEAYATETYPGVVVSDVSVSGYRYPDTLVIWHPSGGTPANASGPPLVSELVLICPDPSDPGTLCEITAPGDSRTIELNDASLNTSSGRSLISGIKSASTSMKTQLTPMLRSAAAGNGSNAALRGAVRFECELHPTAADLSNYRSGSGTWFGLPWPQGIYSATMGLRQVWVRSEIQLLSEPRNADGTVPATASTLPFFGSATNYYTIEN